MKPNKIGQVVKFHTPYPNEDPNQRYVILEIHFDVERPRAKIQELNGGKPFPSTTSVFVEDLEIAEVETNDLLGREVTISKSDYSAAKGNVIKVSEQKIMLDLTKGIKGVETNIWVTILDANGKEHRGTLYVDMQATH